MRRWQDNYILFTLYITNYVMLYYLLLLLLLLLLFLLLLLYYYYYIIIIWQEQLEQDLQGWDAAEPH